MTFSTFRTRPEQGASLKVLETSVGIAAGLGAAAALRLSLGFLKRNHA